MISQLLIHPQKAAQMEQASALLKEFNMTNPHPDLLWIDTEEENSGIEATKRIIEHFKLKPYSAKGRVAVVIGAQDLTVDAQNALLKTLEEPPQDGLLILTAPSESSLLPTILSRCQVVNIRDQESGIMVDFSKIEQLLKANLEERFEFIEKTEGKEQLLIELLHYYHEKLPQDPRTVESAKLLLEAEEWEKANVNVRGILEYLMLKLR